MGALRCGAIGSRHFHGTLGRRLAALLPVEPATPSAHGHSDVQAFRQTAWVPKKPPLFRSDSGSPTTQLPSLHTWFGRDASAQPALSAYVMDFQAWPFPYELVRSSSERGDAVVGFRDWLMGSSDVTDQIMADMLHPAVAQGGQRSFFQLRAPLRLLVKALEFNRGQRSRASDTLELYIAQSALSDLPQPLQRHLPTPDLVQRAGKGDVYSSSIWLGTEPTYTPLHRDPNPNLFCQLCSRKTVRLLPPAVGHRLYLDVQAEIQQRGSSRIRTTEMMEGKERKVLHDAVWGSDAWPDQVHEAKLSPGDALFIPEGWWHSVKSAETDGQLNGSVNWWFR